MKISPAEQAAIKAVLEAGAAFGYGNLISHLQTAWAKMLMQDYGMDEETARTHTACGRSGYPLAMQADLVERGEWDETGKRYAKKPNADEWADTGRVGPP